ncbi:heme ABC transporter ATP-binding protein [Cyclobacterium plantarum]|uniref:heme ABC transporter ATP-binding protein n=1 Tax=Cyclobacterium plantarum TaxID=2716263 RepID=UPI003F6EA3CB
MLEAKNIHFCINNKPIVDQVSIHLKPGEMTVLLGPNGAGKSTLFRLLSGELLCKQGMVRYNGLPISGLKPKELAHLRAVMPQHSTMTFPFQVIEVVMLGLMLSKKKYPSNTVEEVMKATHTWELKNQLYGNLSGGEKQRVQLARVLCQIWDIKSFPRYLLLDEPTSSMDIAQQHHILEIIGQLKHRNIGILAILHDLNLAANYADNAVLLKNGTVIKQGPIREVMTAENLQQNFDYPIHVETDGPAAPIYVSSLPPNKKSSYTTNFKFA